MPMLLLLLSMEKISTDDLSRSNGPGRPTNLIPKTIVLVENRKFIFFLFDDIGVEKRMSAVSSVMKWVILHVIARKNKSKLYPLSFVSLNILLKKAPQRGA